MKTCINKRSHSHFDIKKEERNTVVSKAQGQELENFVHYVYSTLLSDEHQRNAKIEKNHIEIGRSRAKHEFDIFYEVKIAGTSHRVGIECKNHNRKITKGMVQEFAFKLSDCNNITGFMISSKGYQEGAETLGEHYGIKLMTTDDLPHVLELYIKRLGWLIPDENAHADPFWVIMETRNGKNTGSYFSPVDSNAIVLFISKRCAEQVIQQYEPTENTVFGVTREHLRGICIMSQFFKYKILIANKLQLEPDGRLLVFEHPYQEILDAYNLN